MDKNDNNNYLIVIKKNYNDDGLTEILKSF